MKARAEGMRDFGPCLSPQNAWNVLQGIETLSVRMQKHCSNAEKMVEYLLSMRVLLGFLIQVFLTTPTRFSKKTFTTW